MKTSKTDVISGNSSGKSTSSPSTPLFKRQRRMNDESPLSQSEVCWDDSPKRIGIRARSSSLLVLTPVRVVKRHVSSPAIGTIKVKNRFEDLKTTAEEEVVLKKDEGFDGSDDDLFDFSDDQMLAVLKKVDEEEQLRKQKDENKSSTEIFEDSFDDAILASIPLEELSRCSKSKTTNVEIIFNAGMSQIVNETSPARGLTKNKSMETVNHIGMKRTLERHNSLPQQPLTTSKNQINLGGRNPSRPRQCTKEEIEEKRKTAQLRLAQTKGRQRNLKKV